LTSLTVAPAQAIAKNQEDLNKETHEEDRTPVHRARGRTCNKDVGE